MIYELDYLPLLLPYLPLIHPRPTRTRQRGPNYQLNEGLEETREARLRDPDEDDMHMSPRHGRSPRYPHRQPFLGPNILRGEKMSLPLARCRKNIVDAARYLDQGGGTAPPNSWP